MQTPITEMFDIEFPIVAFTHCRDVVVAVSKAGGLGVLGAVAHSDAQLETDLAWIEDELGDRPYGIGPLRRIRRGWTLGGRPRVDHPRCPPRLPRRDAKAVRRT